MFARYLATSVAAVFAVSLVAGGAVRRARSQTPPAAVTPSVELQTWKNIPYRQTGGDPKLNTLDVYAPRNAKNLPVVVFIHGGGWQIGDKSHSVQAKAEGLGRQGYVFVSINYRLAPAVKHREMTQDVAGALAWVHNNIASHSGDPARVFVMGHSAGAHLAALVSTDERYLKNEGLDLKALSGTVLLDSASYDMTRPDGANGFRGKEEMVEQAFGTDPAVLKDASPVFHVAAGKNIPPFLLIHVASRADAKKQTELLASALVKAGVKADVSPAKGKTHMTLNREFGAVRDAPSATAYAFLAGVTGKSVVTAEPAEKATAATVATGAERPSGRDLRQTLQTLNLTAEQKTKIRALLAQHGGDRKSAAFRSAFADLLTPEQKAKIAEGRGKPE